MGALLADAGFVLEPDFNRRSGGGIEKGFFQQITEVF
jgi:hypothetical protein